MSATATNVLKTVEVTIDVFADSMPEPLERDLKLLDAWELSRAARFATPVLRGRYVRSHALLRRVVAGRINEDPASLRFERRCEQCGNPTHGRMRLPAMDAPKFSLSRSGPIAVVACGPGPLGVDVEFESRAHFESEVIFRVSTPVERKRLMTLSGAARDIAFIEMWTRKEAVVKALGVGLLLPFSSFDVSAPGPVVARDGAPPLTVEVFVVSGAHVAVAVSPGRRIDLVGLNH